MSVEVFDRKLRAALYAVTLAANALALYALLFIGIQLSNIGLVVLAAGNALALCFSLFLLLDEIRRGSTRH